MYSSVSSVRALSSELIIKYFSYHSSVVPFFDPDTQTHPQNPTRIDLGDTLKVSCYAHGNPTALFYFDEVFADGTTRNLTVPHKQNGQTDLTINVTTVSELLYRCVASNSIGTNTYEFTVIIQGENIVRYIA